MPIFFLNISRNSEMSKATETIIKGLLQLNPEKRLTATQVREQLKAIIDLHNGIGNKDHLVPEMEIAIDANGHNSTLLEAPREIPSKEKPRQVSIEDCP